MFSGAGQNRYDRHGVPTKKKKTMSSQRCPGHRTRQDRSRNEISAYLAPSIADVVCSYADATPMIVQYVVPHDGRIVLPFVLSVPYDYECTIDWGDGAQVLAYTSDSGRRPRHRYSTPGQVVIITLHGGYDSVPAWDYGELTADAGREGLVSIDWGQVGRLGTRHVSAGFFKGCSALRMVGTPPDIGEVRSTSRMFMGASCFNQCIRHWDVSSVTDMSGMFRDATSYNQPLWIVRNVTTIEEMFSNASAFNQSIGDWEVGTVTNMSGTFAFASSFDQSLDAWNVESVLSMNEMFCGATVFNRYIGSWKPRSVVTMAGMFYEATSFNQSISGWTVGTVTDMQEMFYGASVFNSDIGRWNVQSVTNMRSMFEGAYTFDQDIRGWDVREDTDIGGLLSGATSFSFNPLAQYWMMLRHARGNATRLVQE